MTIITRHYVRYAMPQMFWCAFGQPLIVITLDAALTFKSTFIVVNVLSYCDISWGTTLTHLPSISFHYNLATFLFLSSLERSLATQINVFEVFHHLMDHIHLSSSEQGCNVS